MTTVNSLTLEALAERLAVCKLAPDAPAPAISLHSALVSLTVTPHEISLVCPEEEAPKDAEVVSGWRALRVVGVLDFSLIGILASLTHTLADAGISVFAVSTYTTDYILVNDAALERAVAALRAAGHRVQVAT